MKNKIGELTTQQIVMLIILIVSFIVILLFIFFLDLGGSTDSQICHESVVLRGNSILPSDSVPLKCQTQYLCLSGDKSCESMTNPKIEKVSSKEEAYGLLAEQMANCWWMYGEGKVDYVGKDLTPSRYCSVCNEIAFDNSALDVFPNGQISKQEFYKYLATTKMPDEDKTYLKYMLGTNDINAIRNLGGNQQSDFGEIKLSSRYYILTAMDSKIDFLTWGGGAGAVIGVVSLLVPGGAVLWSIQGVMFVVGVAGTGATAGAYVGNVVEGESGNTYIPPIIVEARSKIFKGLNCSDINTLA